MPCVYFGEDTGREKRGRKVHVCQINGQCVRTGGGRRIASCDDCKRSLQITDPTFPVEWEDPLTVIDRRRTPSDALRGTLGGRSVFLMGGGPSVEELPLEHLSARRGVWTMAVNNSAGHARIRPQAFVCSDPPSKFSHSIWLDPGIMKFIPTPKMKGGRSNIRRKCSDGMFELMKERVTDCPNVWGFKRQSWLIPDDGFFLTDGAPWGNHDKGVKRTGQPKTVCTLLLGLRLLRYLGAGRVYLIGVDFRMTPDAGYSFPQGRTEGACESNNRQFAVVNQWLCEMEGRGVFRRFGMEVYNCYERSGLRAFPYVPIDRALADAVGIIEEEPSLENWYEKTNNRKDKK